MTVARVAVCCINWLAPVIIMLILLQTKLFMQTKLRKQCTVLSVVAGANVNYKLTVGV